MPILHLSFIIYYYFMGKKKITTQDEAGLKKETDALESASKKVAGATLAVLPSSKRFIKHGKAYVQSTYNNTIVTITDDAGNVLTWASAGSLGFKGAKKSTPFAASKVVEAIVERLKKIGLQEVSVFVKGIGSGRESAVRSLATNLQLSSITDITPIPHNGCRPPKVRRV